MAKPIVAPVLGSSRFEHFAVPQRWHALHSVLRPIDVCRAKSLATILTTITDANTKKAVLLQAQALLHHVSPASLSGRTLLSQVAREVFPASMLSGVFTLWGEQVAQTTLISSMESALRDRLNALAPQHENFLSPMVTLLLESIVKSLMLRQVHLLAPIEQGDHGVRSVLAAADVVALKRFEQRLLGAWRRLLMLPKTVLIEPEVTHCAITLYARCYHACQSSLQLADEDRADDLHQGLCSLLQRQCVAWQLNGVINEDRCRTLAREIDVLLEPPEPEVTLSV